jgi:hypothetical protein
VPAQRADQFRQALGVARADFHEGQLLHAPVARTDGDLQVFDVQGHPVTEQGHLPHRASQPSIGPAPASGPSVDRTNPSVTPAVHPDHPTAFYRHRVDHLPAQPNNPCWDSRSHSSPFSKA